MEGGVYYEAAVSLAQVQLWRLPEYVLLRGNTDGSGVLFAGTKKKKKASRREREILSQPHVMMLQEPASVLMAGAETFLQLFLQMQKNKWAWLET